MIRAIDVASYQPREIGPLLEATESQAAIVHLYLPWEKPDLHHSLAQINSARAAGAVVGAYVFLYPDADPIKTVDEATNIIWACWPADARPRVLWIDVEAHGELPKLNQVEVAINRCYEAPIQPGIYTSKAVWTEYGNPSVFNDVPLWTADWGSVPALDTTPLYGGWHRRLIWGHQWTSQLVDQSVFREIAFGIDSRI